MPPLRFVMVHLLRLPQVQLVIQSRRVPHILGPLRIIQMLPGSKMERGLVQ